MDNLFFFQFLNAQQVLKIKKRILFEGAFLFG